MTMSLAMRSLDLGFRHRFEHHSASRSATETVIVTARADGIEGFGEGCPRHYVTGETVASCLQFFEHVRPQAAAVRDRDELIALSASKRDQIAANPSAWCAIEMAILDWLARRKGVSVENLLGVATPTESPVYSAVLGIEGAFGFFKKAAKYRLFGFRHFKIKLSGNAEKDRAALRTLKRLGVTADRLRLDANNLWSKAEDVVDALAPLRPFFWALEEPLRPGDFAGLEKVARALGVKVILDESFRGDGSLDAVRGRTDLFIPNVRVSKVGGVSKALDITRVLRAAGARYIVGSHVGETSLLSRAALALASSAEAVAYEGAFSTHLLSRDPFVPHVKLGFGGKVKIGGFASSAGWGLSYSEDNV